MKKLIVVMLSTMFVVKVAAADVNVENNQSAALNPTTLTAKNLDSYWNSRDNANLQKNIAKTMLAGLPLPSDYATNWKIARMVSFIGNYGADADKYKTTSLGVKLFGYGVAAAQKAMQLDPSKVEGVFWYAVNLGSYGIAKGGLTELSNSGKWFKAVTAAYKIDPSYDWYGSSRMLGVYYQVLPRVAGGNLDTANRYLQQAVTSAPDFKDNWVTLGFYYLNIGDKQNAKMVCNKALSLPNVGGDAENIVYNKNAKRCLSQAGGS